MRLRPDFVLVDVLKWLPLVAPVLLDEKMAGDFALRGHRSKGMGGTAADCLSILQS